MLRAYRFALGRLTALEQRTRVLAVDVLLWGEGRLIRLRGRLGTAADHLEAWALAVEPATRHIDDDFAELVDELARRRTP